MADECAALRDWHRLFGLLLTDFFSGSPFKVEVEPDLSQQQQLLDVVVVRRGRGRFVGRLPDGLTGLAEHNLITFKSHHEALNAWAMKELASHSVAYRKLVSRSPSDLLPEEQFRLYAVTARFPRPAARARQPARGAVPPVRGNCPLPAQPGESGAVAEAAGGRVSLPVGNGHGDRHRGGGTAA